MLQAVRVQFHPVLRTSAHPFLKTKELKALITFLPSILQGEVGSKSLEIEILILLFFIKNLIHQFWRLEMLQQPIVTPRVLNLKQLLSLPGHGTVLAPLPCQVLPPASAELILSQASIYSKLRAVKINKECCQFSDCFISLIF